MLFKLSIKNMKKSMKDYTIYFLTLVLGVAIFYIFNSLDSQQAMLDVTKSTHQMIDLMIQLLAGVSVFVSIILGFLIVYANNFLIKRRKKEFGIYMTLGMSKGKISKILIIETLLVGVLSLAVGLVVGIFGSQLMSVLVAKLFAVDMAKFEFVFSSAACIKTCVYFGIAFLLVMIFNVFTISKYKLIDLLTAIKKTEKVKIKKTFVSVILFLVSIALLIGCYYKVTTLGNNLDNSKFMIIVGIGAFATFLFFWSLSGFVLKLIQSCKKLYLKNLNMFILRQTNAKINTTVFSMTIICLLLFMTICILSSAISLNNTMQSNLQELTPVDINFHKRLDNATNNEYGQYYANAIKNDPGITVREALDKVEVDMNQFKDVIELTSYSEKGLTLERTLGNAHDEAKKIFPRLATDSAEEIIKVSDYNKVAKLYGIEEFSLKDNEYMIICDYQNMKNLRDLALKDGVKLTIADKEYSPKYTECKDGFILMSSNHINTGIILVPDSCEFIEDSEAVNYLIANYNATTDEQKEEIEERLSSKELEKRVEEAGIYFSANTKISIYSGAIGISTIVTFIAIYLGIIFLISSAAILALKELSESSDNKQRYSILRKIGVDEKMINRALFTQIGIFFIIPLVLAIVHSIFGIQVALQILSSLDTIGDLTIPIVITAIFIILIYGGYFIATYFGSKNIIKEE